VLDIEVVYVENDESVNVVMTSILKKKLKTVHSFKDGLDAWDFLKNNKTDIVITDIMMPRLNGLELAENIRTIDNEIPIIVISAHADVEKLLQAFNLGISQYLIKPIDPGKLFQQLIRSTEIVINK